MPRPGRRTSSWPTPPSAAWPRDSRRAPCPCLRPCPSSATSPRRRARARVRGMGRDLARLIDQCLAISPDQRPRDAAAVLAALDRVERRRRRRPYMLLALAAPVLLLSLLTLLGFWEGSNALE